MLGEAVTFIIPIEGQKNKFAVGTGKHLSTITWDGTSKKATNLEKIAEVDTGPETAKNRINDGKADPRGRIFFGTMGHESEPGICEPKKGSVYSFFQGKLCKHTGGMTVSNGLAWNEALKKFYFVDSAVKKILQFDYNPDSGDICKTAFSNKLIYKKKKKFPLSQHDKILKLIAPYSIKISDSFIHN